jgi:hypothetical protein
MVLVPLRPEPTTNTTRRFDMLGSLSAAGDRSAPLAGTEDGGPQPAASVGPRVGNQSGPR